MQESLSPEHSSELFTDSLEQFLDGSRVTNECTRHLQTSWWNIADGSLDIVWNPIIIKENNFKIIYTKKKKNLLNFKAT